MLLKSIGVIAIGVFVLGMTNIQAAPQAPDDHGWYQNRDSFYRAEGWRMRFFDRIREDLNRVQDVTFHQKDQDRIVQTENQLTDLQIELGAKTYNQPELDAVIGSLTAVVADNRLSPRDRDMLSDDLSRLRDYRFNHDNWH